MPPINPITNMDGFTKIQGRDGEFLNVTRSGYLRASTENLEFFDTIDGTSINTNLWNQSTSGMTIAQTSAFLSLNTTNVTTANAYAIVSSIANFFMTPTNPLYIRFSLAASLMILPANTVMEFGWGTVSGVAAPTDGVFIRIINGAAYLVFNNAGTETLTQFTLPALNTTDEYWLAIYGMSAKFYMDNSLIAAVDAPATAGAITNTNRQPFFLRVYNGASVPASSPTLKLGQVSIQNLNAEFCKPFSDKLIGMGRSAVQSPSAFTALSNYANSAAPASASLSNTTAGYTTLGGQWQFAMVAGAETDYALFGFQVPASYQLYISDVRISMFNTGAVNSATVPTVLQWALGINSSAVSLATTDGVGTWGPRVICIGSQNLAISAPVGQGCNDVLWSTQINLLVDGGRFLHVILKIPVGAATASQIIRGTVAVNGYFE